MSVTTSTIGFPRIGRKREMKIALERYWKKQSTLQDMLAVQHSVEEESWKAQKSAGVALVGIDQGTLYDHVLDTTFLIGCIPDRFKGLSGYDAYFAMARGAQGAVALDMSKYFDTNYHFLVPELEEGWTPAPDFSHFLDRVQRCQATVGKESAVPILLGPVTYASLARSNTAAAPDLDAVLAKLLPVYLELLQKLKELQVPEVQLHEPYLTTTKGAKLQAPTSAAYKQLAAQGVSINFVTYYDDLGEAYPWVVSLPVSAVSLDFLGVPGASAPNASLDLVRQHGFPAGKRLGAGVVDGRSVWRDTGIGGALLAELRRLLPSTPLSVQPSVPLSHLPWDTALEQALDQGVTARLGFAVQKLGELVQLAKGVTNAPADASPVDLSSFRPKELTFEIPDNLYRRPEAYSVRRSKQISMPAFPTTTIGSFPQTADVRRLRLQYKQGRLSQAEYERGIASHIGFAIGMQEALGLDVLVHGEAERTDMVEYFGAGLTGMAFTEHGWVQSYGSRYVRPPLVVGDIAFNKPMTVWEYKVAQALTPRPVKGMLTGPVTILNWSFPRRDISRRAQALQLALALREEVAALEAAGCTVVQVDDPALREGLPLKAERWQGYLGWAVDAFRLTTAVAAPATQIVTHLCYSDFQDIMAAIDAMDADVLTIENSRSSDEMIRALAAAQYGRDIGPGVYDVHSPVVPTVEFMKEKIRSFVASGILGGAAGATRVWVNPDCGLKTRGWDETIGSLRNMVQASAEVRAELAATGAVAPPAPSATVTAAKPGAGCGCKA
ncbi:cobalamin-independent methionine synthase [Haematococcus lacustris]